MALSLTITVHSRVHQVKAVRTANLHIGDDAVILAEAVQVLSEALESLSGESEPPGLRVS